MDAQIAISESDFASFHRLNLNLLVSPIKYVFACLDRILEFVDYTLATMYFTVQAVFTLTA